MRAVTAFFFFVLATFTTGALITSANDTQIETNERVAHGTTVTLADAARSMAYVVSRQLNTLCSATVIANEWILLAAHCSIAKGDPVRVGVHHGHKGTSHTVVSFHRHRDFKKERFTILSDALLAKITPPVSSNVAIKLNYDSVEPRPNSDVYGFGYGFDENDARPLVLRTAKFHAVPTVSCQRKLSNANHPTSARKLNNVIHICANENHVGKGMCSGDSGGPLIMKTRHGFVQVGISSYRVSKVCGSVKLPDVYTRVSRFYGWTRYVIRGGRRNGRLPRGFIL